MADSLDYSKQFVGTELTTSNQTLLTLSAGTLRNMIVTISNKTGSVASATLYLVPSGGTAGDDGSNLYTSYSIPANDYRELSIPKMIAGDFLVAVSDTLNALEVFENDGTVRV